jgi:malate dehydrogenase (oxaloacetate-decarboxylating)
VNVSDRDPEPPRGISLPAGQPDDIERSFTALGLGAGDVDIVACGAPAPGDLPGGADEGAGGMRSAEGTLAVYAAGAGIRPERMIAVSLEAGTSYEAFIRSYVQTAATLFPAALLHFAGFGAGWGRAIVQAYGGGYRVFDDATQGTGAVALAAMYAASRVTGIPMKHQAVVVFGAGPAGAAIAALVHDAIVADGAAAEQARDQIWLADEPAGLAAVIDQAAPTVLLGASAVRRAFSREVIEAMCKATSRPLILPISTHASRAEAAPSDVIAWSGGRALVASGSPAGPVRHDGTTFTIGQADSALIFPGVGLGVIVSRAATVTPRMLQAAATAVAEQAGPSRPGSPLLPGVHDLRATSAQVAEAVVRAAVADKVAAFNPTSVARAVRDAMRIPADPDTG